MDIQAIKGMTREDAIAEAAKYAGVRPEILDSIWNRETRRGTHPTMIGPDTPWGTAKGHFQMLDATHATIENRLGTKLDRFNFHDSLIGAAELMRENVQRFGNEADAVRAYFAGPNKKLWGQKTEEYVNGVLGTEAPLTAATSSRPAPAVARPASSWVVGAGDVASAQADAAPLHLNMQPPEQFARAAADKGMDYTAYTQAAGAAVAKETARENTNVFGSIYDRSNILGATYANTMDSSFRLLDKAINPTYKPDAAWKAEFNRTWEKQLEGAGDEERADLWEAVNADQAAAIRFQYAEKRENDAVVSTGGVASQLATGLTAGMLDPTTWATGIAATKAFALAGYGSVALAQAGKPAAAVLSNAAENVVGNVAYEGVKQLLGEHRSVNDYALAAVTGLIPSIVTGPLTYRDAINHMRMNTMADVVKKEIAMAERAIRNVGADATPEVQRAELRRLEAEEVSDNALRRKAPLNESDRVNAPDLNDPEVLKPFAEQAEAPKAPVMDAQVHVEPQTKYADPGHLIEREKLTEGYLRISGSTLSEGEWHALKPGTHVDPTLVGNADVATLAKTLEALRMQLAPDMKLGLSTVTKSMGEAGVKAEGAYTALGRQGGVIALDLNAFHPGQTLAHEFGHALFIHRINKIDPALMQGMLKEFDYWKTRQLKATGGAQDAAMMRSPIGRAAATNRVFGKAAAGVDSPIKSLENLIVDAFEDKGKAWQYMDYFSNFDEFAAEQFVKFTESQHLAGTTAKLSVPKQIVTALAAVVRDLLEVFNYAKANKMLKPTASFEKFFLDTIESVQRGSELSVPSPAAGVGTGPVHAPALAAAAPGVDPVAQRHGLDLMPEGTPKERAEKKFVRDLYAKADEWAARNPRDDAKVKVIGNNNLVNVATPATLLATSDNNLSRWIAANLIEQTTGAVERRSTAAIMKYELERDYIGNTLLEYDQFYRSWRSTNGGGWIEDHFKGEVRNKFNKAVALEQESRQLGIETTPDPMVKAAADSLEKSFDRMRLSQIDTKVTGWARMPNTSRGYMPHRIAAARMQELSHAELRVVTDIIDKQLQAIEGFDAKFSKNLAKQYIDHARVNAAGGHEIPTNIHDPAAASRVEGALKAMGMDQEEVLAAMGRFAAGGATQTKRRLHLDLATEFPTENGNIRLLDIFDTDHINLLRSQARRVSGEVALVHFGVQGAQGLTLLRRGLEFGEVKADLRQLEAFDQVAAEMLGRPFGTADNKWLDRVLTANATARLGGMGFNQFGEYINAVAAIGVGNTFDAISSIPRLRGEVAALARGEKVHNSIINSMELPDGGGEFGLDGYKMVTSFDSPEHAYASYGRDGIQPLDRVLRSAAHIQGTLSLHRMIHAVQLRGMAEQITMKALKYIRDGGNSVALKDMGFTDAVVAGLKADLDNMVKWGPNGGVASFDITKATNIEAATAFAQGVRRGSAQIIQGAFVGETGKWAHAGWLKLLTQFRSYPLLAMEKQWARQKGNYGVAGALGILMGSAAAVTPIYFARVALGAIGRPDKDEYLEKRLSAAAVARASLNYVGISGMMPDFLDAMSNVTGVGQATGGRSGATKSLVGSVVPGVGYVDDVYRAAAAPDAHKIAKLLPWANTPLLLPAVNALRPD